MKKKLCDIVNLISNDEDCVILEVKPNSKMDLIKLGCFSGFETMFRLTKGEHRDCTIWTAESAFTFGWGGGHSTCVTSETSKAGSLIQECIAEDFNIVLEGKNIANTLGNPASFAKTAVFKEMWWDNHDERTVHKDGEFFKHFKTHEDFIVWLEKHGWTIDSTGPESFAPSGCLVVEHVCTRA